MARPGTWNKEVLLKMHSEIKESGSTIKDYCEKNKIGYHKLYQAFRRSSIVGEYAPSKQVVAEIAKTIPSGV